MIKAKSRGLRPRFQLWAGVMPAIGVLVLGSLFSPGHAEAELVNNQDGTGSMNLVVNYRYPPSGTEIAELHEHFKMASRILCDVTEGQVRIDNVTVTAGSKKEDNADIWVLSESGRAHVTGVGWDEPDPRRPGFGIRADEKVKTDRVILYGDSLAFKGGSVLAHELMHYAFGVKDQYLERWLMGSACGMGAGFDAGLSEQDTSLMQSDPAPSCQTPDPASPGNWVTTHVQCLPDDPPCGAGERCYISESSELSYGAYVGGGVFQGNHDPVNGLDDVTDCPGPLPTESLNLSQISVNNADPIDDTDLSGLTFEEAEAASFAAITVELVDGLGNIGYDLYPGPSLFDLYIYYQHIAQDSWRVSFGIDERDLASGNPNGPATLVILDSVVVSGTPPVPGCGDGLVDRDAGEECEPGPFGGFSCFLVWAGSGPIIGPDDMEIVPEGEIPCNDTTCT